VLKMIGAEGGSRTRTPFRTTDLSPMEAASRNFTKRYEPVFIGLAAVEALPQLQVPFSMRSGLE